MKVESRRLLHFAGRFGAGVVRSILASSRVTESVEDSAWHPRMGGRQKDYILSCWHENLIIGAWWCGRLARFHTIASQSKDGEIIAGCASSLGMEIIRGSSSQGGATAVRQVLAASKTAARFRCAVTPDGPRGPRRQMKSGVVYIASRLNLPIVCLAIATKNPWRLGSWDRMQIPRPFQRVHIHLSAPLRPSPELNREGVEDFAHLLQREMDRAHARAEESLDPGSNARRGDEIRARRAA